jgi:phytanoyl-CoA hydroxylase
MLNKDQLEHYKENGFVIVKNMYDEGEGQKLIEHMMSLHTGEKQLEGFKQRNKNDWDRTMNTHTFDELMKSYLLDSKLETSLEQMCDDKVDGLQTMYFYKGSQQNRHQDQYYLPDCFSAWTAFQDVTIDNGCLWVQPGSHKKELLDRAYFVEKYGDDVAVFGDHYDDEVNALFERNNIEEVPVLMDSGDTLFFNGKLIHRGGPVSDESLFRHSLANHYIPYGSEKWNKKGWLRYSFEGEVRDTAA